MREFHKTLFEHVEKIEGASMEVLSTWDEETVLKESVHLYLRSVFLAYPLGFHVDTFGRSRIKTEYWE